MSDKLSEYMDICEDLSRKNDARLTDDMVRKAGDILLGYVNAPEQVIYGAAREMLEASLAIAMARQNAEKVERMRALTARIAELEEALLPFREAFVLDVPANAKDECIYRPESRVCVVPITVGDLRRAAAALKEGKDNG